MMFEGTKPQQFTAVMVIRRRLNAETKPARRGVSTGAARSEIHCGDPVRWPVKAERKVPDLSKGGDRGRGMPTIQRIETVATGHD